uniref:DUF5641 domain-containing protein n=1 Tax=Amphimedon queenslandica TaxID=400682 RepID=A0A1X7UTG3_AMPQE
MRKEYLIILRERYYVNKQSPSSREVRVGDIVIVHTDQDPRGFWRLGRVTELITGNDGFVRGALVYTLSKDNHLSLLRRPVQRLYPLEICQEGDTPHSRSPHSNTHVAQKQIDVSRSSVEEPTNSLGSTCPSRAPAS